MVIPQFHLRRQLPQNAGIAVFGLLAGQHVDGQIRQLLPRLLQGRHDRPHLQDVSVLLTAVGTLAAAFPVQVLGHPDVHLAHPRQAAQLDEPVGEYPRKLRLRIADGPGLAALRFELREGLKNTPTCQLFQVQDYGNRINPAAGPFPHHRLAPALEPRIRLALRVHSVVGNLLGDVHFARPHPAQVIIAIRAPKAPLRQVRPVRHAGQGNLHVPLRIGPKQLLQRPGRIIEAAPGECHHLQGAASLVRDNPVSLVGILERL